MSSALREDLSVGGAVAGLVRSRGLASIVFAVLVVEASIPNSSTIVDATALTVTASVVLAPSLLRCADHHDGAPRVTQHALGGRAEEGRLHAS